MAQFRSKANAINAQKELLIEQGFPQELATAYIEAGLVNPVRQEGDKFLFNETNLENVATGYRMYSAISLSSQLPPFLPTDLERMINSGALKGIPTTLNGTLLLRDKDIEHLKEKLNEDTYEAVMHELELREQALERQKEETEDEDDFSYVAPEKKDTKEEEVKPEHISEEIIEEHEIPHKEEKKKEKPRRTGQRGDALDQRSRNGRLTQTDGGMDVSSLTAGVVQGSDTINATGYTGYQKATSSMGEAGNFVSSSSSNNTESSTSYNSDIARRRQEEQTRRTEEQKQQNEENIRKQQAYEAERLRQTQNVSQTTSYSHGISESSSSPTFENHSQSDNNTDLSSSNISSETNYTTYAEEIARKQAEQIKQQEELKKAQECRDREKQLQEQQTNIVNQNQVDQSQNASATSNVFTPDHVTVTTSDAWADSTPVPLSQSNANTKEMETASGGVTVSLAKTMFGNNCVQGGGVTEAKYDGITIATSKSGNYMSQTIRSVDMDNSDNAGAKSNQGIKITTKATGNKSARITTNNRDDYQVKVENPDNVYRFAERQVHKPQAGMYLSQALNSMASKSDTGCAVMKIRRVARIGTDITSSVSQERRLRTARKNVEDDIIKDENTDWMKHIGMSTEDIIVAQNHYGGKGTQSLEHHIKKNRNEFGIKGNNTLEIYQLMTHPEQLKKKFKDLGYSDEKIDALFQTRKKTKLKYHDYDFLNQKVSAKIEKKYYSNDKLNMANMSAKDIKKLIEKAKTENNKELVALLSKLEDIKTAKGKVRKPSLMNLTGLAIGNSDLYFGLSKMNQLKRGVQFVYHNTTWSRTMAKNMMKKGLSVSRKSIATGSKGVVQITKKAVRKVTHEVSAHGLRRGMAKVTVDAGSNGITLIAKGGKAAAKGAKNSGKIVVRHIRKAPGRAAKAVIHAPGKTGKLVVKKARKKVATEKAWFRKLKRNIKDFSKKSIKEVVKDSSHAVLIAVAIVVIILCLLQIIMGGVAVIISGISGGKLFETTSDSNGNNVSYLQEAYESLKDKESAWEQEIEELVNNREVKDIAGERVYSYEDPRPESNNAKHEITAIDVFGTADGKNQNANQGKKVNGKTLYSYNYYNGAEMKNMKYTNGNHSYSSLNRITRYNNWQSILGSASLLDLHTEVTPEYLKDVCNLWFDESHYYETSVSDLYMCSNHASSGVGTGCQSMKISCLNLTDDDNTDYKTPYHWNDNYKYWGNLWYALINDKRQGNKKHCQKYYCDLKSGETRSDGISVKDVYANDGVHTKYKKGGCITNIEINIPNDTTLTFYDEWDCVNREKNPTLSQIRNEAEKLNHSVSNYSLKDILGEGEKKYKCSDVMEPYQKNDSLIICEESINNMEQQELTRAEWNGLKAKVKGSNTENIDCSHCYGAKYGKYYLYYLSSGSDYRLANHGWYVLCNTLKSPKNFENNGNYKAKFIPECTGHKILKVTFGGCNGHWGCCGHTVNYCTGHAMLLVNACIGGISNTEDEKSGVDALGQENIRFDSTILKCINLATEDADENRLFGNLNPPLAQNNSDWKKYDKDDLEIALLRLTDMDFEDDYQLLID